MRTHTYKLTTVSCFVGIFTQAIINNLTAILFIPLMKLYDFNYVQLGVLVGINFAAQVLSDIIFSGVIDKVGFRKIVIPTCILAFCGLLLFALTPNIFSGYEFFGFIISTIIFAFSSGLLEVVLSPIIDAIPNEEKGASMSLMHSFYAWGQVATILLTTLFLFFVDIKLWQVAVLFWSAIPLIALFLFSKAPMPPNSAEKTRSKGRDLLRSPFYLIALIAIMFGGATEVCMNQWASTFMNGALEIPKVVGDLLGMCGFAVMLGVGRMLYGFFGGKINIHKVLIAGSGICVICYIIVALSPFNALNIFACAVTGFFCSILWPGVIVVSADKYPLAGAWMFAILAAAGDIGAGVGPYITGLITDYTADWNISKVFVSVYNTTTSGASMRLGILFALIFPLVTFISHIAIKKLGRK